MISQGLFTSEAVSRGHPDKICDQISDAVLDAAMDRDPNARVAVETLIKDQSVILAGELTLRGAFFRYGEIEQLVRGVVRDIGYTEDLNIGFDHANCQVDWRVGEQSPDIAQGVNTKAKKRQGAGDQGLIFGFACNETRPLMPAPIYYAHQLMRRHEAVRKGGGRDILRPDAKSQVTFHYKGGQPVSVDTVVLSTHHAEGISQANLRELVREEIIDPVIPKRLRKGRMRILINPTGRFVIGGPVGDCGLTGRKIIVDTYGGMARHGGGAFSGKDLSKVDRSAAYAARYVAKHLVGNKLADRCEVQVAYAIGYPTPVSVAVDTFGTGKISDVALAKFLQKGEVFDLSPGGIIDMLGLLDPKRRPCYQKTARHGHFGYPDGTFPWEALDRTKHINKLLPF